ncbi:hypothetical protein ACWGB8_18715 [Kitasatospora sp. NPDC054939]
MNHLAGRTAAALTTLVLLLLATACGSGGSGTSTDDKEKPMRSASKQQVEEELRGQSDTVHKALGVQGRRNEDNVDAISFLTCSDKAGKRLDGTYNAAFFWSIEEVDPAELQPAVTRLHEYMKANGWTATGFGQVGKSSDYEAWGTHPQLPVTVKVESVAGMRRIAVTTGTGCHKRI